MGPLIGAFVLPALGTAVIGIPPTIHPALHFCLCPLFLH